MCRLATLSLATCVCSAVACGLSVTAAAACDLSEPEKGTVAAVIDGETLKLADGRIVRLIGAKAPMPPLGWRGEDPWPLVDEAKEALSRLASGKEVELRYGGSRTDRHGYALAQVYVTGGAGQKLWLQQELVGQGLARVYSFPDNRACVPELLASEADARAKKLGVWGSPVYRIESADNLERLGRLTQTYQLVEGTVLSVGQGAGRVYLNFARLAERLHHLGRAQGCGRLHRRRHRPQGAGRQEAPRARLGHVAERPDDRGHSPRADRSARG